MRQYLDEEPLLVIEYRERAGKMTWNDFDVRFNSLITASAVRVDCHGKPINSQWKLTNRREKREKGRLLFNSSFFLFVERDEAWAGALLICKQSKKRNHPGAHPSLYSVLFRSVADSSSRWFPCANIWSAPPSCSSSSLCMSIWRFNNRLNASIRQPGSAPSADF